MSNNRCIYTQQQPPNGPTPASCYSPSSSSSSSSPFGASMGMVFADMSSLSIDPKNGVTQLLQESPLSKTTEIGGGGEGRGCWGFPSFLKGGLEDHHHQHHNQNNSDVEEGGKGSSDCSDGFGENSEPIIDLNAAALSGEDHQHHHQPIMHVGGVNSNNGKEAESTGQSKLCARGHWRPAEDAKLKELVAIYGPQNWNLIAEKLEGRSGKNKVPIKKKFSSLSIHCHYILIITTFLIV